MTVAVGIDPGAAMAEGRQVGKGQTPMAAVGLGKELSANWLKPASGNLATGLASEAPSFRSSWQAQVDAWRGVSRGTNVIEFHDASEADASDAMNGAPGSLAAKDEQTSPSAQRLGSSFQSVGAGTKQNAFTSDVAGQKESWPQINSSASEAIHNAGAQSMSTGSAISTATARSGAANRSRVSSVAKPSQQEITAQATTAGAPTTAPAIASPIQPPATPAPSQIPTLAQTVETTSAPESNFAVSNLRSMQFSGRVHFSGPQLSGAGEIASVATGSLAIGAPGSDTATGVRTQTMRTGLAFVPRNTTVSEAMHETAASSLDDANEPAASGQITSLSSFESHSAEPWHGPLIAQTAAVSNGLSGQSAPGSSAANLVDPATVESAASVGAPHATVYDPAQDSADTMQDASKPFADRATPSATNHDATGHSAPGATQVSAAPPAGVDAAASPGLRFPGAAQISTAPAHDQLVATAAWAAATPQDTFAALDAGTPPGTPAWTHAGSQHAEAGFRDPALGWVSVRADLSAVGIHATLVPDSAEAAQALNGHLAGLSTHLVEQHSPVASVTMALPSESGVENGMGQRMQQGAEGNPQGNAPEQAQPGANETAPPSRTSVLDAPLIAGIQDSVAHRGNLHGTHISVMA